MHVYEYFEHKLGVAPRTAELKTMPLDSPCGDDCKTAIDAAHRFMRSCAAAFGEQRAQEMVVEQINEVVECFVFG